MKTATLHFYYLRSSATRCVFPSNDLMIPAIVDIGPAQARDFDDRSAPKKPNDFVLAVR